MVEAAFAARKPPPKKKKKACETCGKLFDLNRATRRYCSKSCAAKQGHGPNAKADRFHKKLTEYPKRRLGRYVVYVPPDRKPFVLVKRVDGRIKARDIEVRVCVRCEREYVWQIGARKDQSTCSRKCGMTERRRKFRETAWERGGGPKKATLDTVFSRIVRSAGSCRRCGTTDSLQCAHIISRRYLGTRYDEANALCLCARCHLFFTHRPLEWEAYIAELFGEEYLPGLKRRALAFQGPLDRMEVARGLYPRADVLGVHVPGVRCGTLKDDFDEEAS